MQHEHKIIILRQSAKSIWLLIFPLLRSFNIILSDKEWFYHWLKGAWFDILFVAAIVFFGYIKWECSKIWLNDDDLVREEGIFCKVKTKMAYVNISSVTAERLFYLTPFNAVKLRIDTRSGFMTSADISLVVSEKTYSDLIKKIPGSSVSEKVETAMKPTALSIILFSIFFSSGLSGTVYIAAFFFQGGKIAQDMIGASISRITEQTEKISSRLILRIPDAAIAVGLFFIAAWVLSITVNILRYSMFYIKADERNLYTIYGTANRREHRITTSHINYIDLRQNLIMKLFSAVAVHISCAGYGTAKRSLPVLLPVKKEKNIAADLEAIGMVSGVKNDFNAKRYKIWQYIWLPTITAVFVFPLHIVISRLFPVFGGLSLFAAVMAEIPSVWLIVVKLVSFFTSGISLYDDNIMVRCCKWTGFHTLIANRKKLVKLSFEHTLFQKRKGICSVCMWFEGEKHIKYKVKAIAVSDAKMIAKLLDREFRIV